MKLIKTAIPNRYVNADAVLELFIQSGGEIVSEDCTDCYKIMALVQTQSHPIVLGVYSSQKSAEINLGNLAKHLSSTKPYEIKGAFDVSVYENHNRRTRTANSSSRHS